MNKKAEKYVKEIEINDGKQSKYLSFGNFLGKNIEAIYTKSLNFNVRRIEENKERNLNARRVMKEFGIHLLYLPNTKHTSEVQNINTFPEEMVGLYRDITEGDDKQYTLKFMYFDKDAVIGNIPGKPIAMQLADCNVIYLFDEKTKTYGIVHSGWQGTLNLIIINTIEEMKKNFNINPKNLKVVLGPSISKDSFETEEDVYIPFEKMINGLQFDPNKYIYKKDNNKKRYIDLKGIIIDILKEKYKIKEENILNIDEDTYSKKEKSGMYSYHSHRRDGKIAGRNMAMIYLKRDDKK